MKKRVRDKSFKPCAVDDGDEVFPNGIFLFNISKMLAFIRQNPDRFTVTQVEVESLYQQQESLLDKGTIHNADLSVPIVLAEISPGRLNVIDGNHRVARALRDGVASLPAYRIEPEQHVAFLTTALGYEKYVEYWNEKLAANDQASAKEDYNVVVCNPDLVRKPDLAACVKIVKAGAAVAPRSAETEIYQACAVAIACKGKVVVGTGAIKRFRPDYAKTIERRASVTLDRGILELGYIAVESTHQGKGLSKQIISKLLAARSGPLFATTDNDRMKRTLTVFGFVQKGSEWRGNRGFLSLWIRE